MLRRFAFFGDVVLILLLVGVLISSAVGGGSFFNDAIIVINLLAFIPLVVSAGSYAVHRKISVELLAAIALFLSMTTGEWRSAAFINLMLASARVFQRFTEDRGRKAITSLAKLRPKEALIRKGYSNERVAISSIMVGNELILTGGESVAADGRIIEGSGDFDESSVTGESLPVSKSVGDKVIGGTILLSGGAVAVVEHVGEDTVLGRIMRLVSDAEGRESRLQSVVSRFASLYIILAIIAALAIFIFSHDMRLVLSVLLVVCADDVAVAVPLAFLAAITIAASRGAIVKGAPFIENLAKAKTFFFDKTGTLTSGKMEVEESVFFGDISGDLRNALASMLSLATHPSARAVVRALNAEKNDIEVRNFSEKRGLGMSSSFDGKVLCAGRIKLLEELGVTLSEDESARIKSISEKGLSIVSVALDDKVIAAFGIADKIRKEAKDMVSALQALGDRRILMLTGDNKVVAERVASSLGISEFRSDLLPEEKIGIIGSGEYSSPIVMVGDGVNDAAALAGADVGIAMGGIGSEAAVESADIVLMKDDLTVIPQLVDISRDVFIIVKQNIAIWVIVNAIGLVLVFAGIIGPAGAALYNFATDFIPIMNSMRIFISLRSVRSIEKGE